MGSRAAGRTIYGAADVLGDLSRDGDSVLYLPANRRVFIAVPADAFASLDQIRVTHAGAERAPRRRPADGRLPDSAGDCDSDLGGVVTAARLPVLQPGIDANRDVLH
jgi:hypothetical protein